jgi:hypothetical protein
MFLASENGVWYGKRATNNIEIMRLERKEST